MTPRNESSVVGASAWMVAVTLALFFLPAINGLLGGAIGGYKAGGVRRALIAALLPAVIVGVALGVLFALFDAGGWGLLAGLTGGVVVALAELSLFLGALIGGYAASRGAGVRRLPA